MNAWHSITNYIVPTNGTVCPDASLQKVCSLMEAGKANTIVVTDEDKPVGVIRRSDINCAVATDRRSLARDIMFAHYPVVLRGASRCKVRSLLDRLNLDRLPVVNQTGTLIGVVDREALGETMSPHNRDGHPNGREASRQSRPIRRAFKVRPGMNVYSSDHQRLGLVDRMFLERGTVTGFVMTHGLLDRRHKQLQFDVVDHLENETVILGLDQSAFYQIPDCDPNAI